LWFSNLQPGEILVVPFTDIGWSPYFPLISGLVTEIGGLISHGIKVIFVFAVPYHFCNLFLCLHYLFTYYLSLSCKITLILLSFWVEFLKNLTFCAVWNRENLYEVHYLLFSIQFDIYFRITNFTLYKMHARHISYRSLH